MSFWAMEMVEACVDSGECSPGHLQIVAQDLPEPRTHLCMVYK